MLLAESEEDVIVEMAQRITADNREERDGFDDDVSWGPVSSLYSYSIGTEPLQ